MSPARARTSSADVLAAARALLEAGGLEALTMQAVAERIGVRAPSLYKRFDGRAALVAAVAGDALEELGVRLRDVEETPDATAGIRALATVYRDFARSNPRTYELLFMNLPDAFRPSPEGNARASRPLLVLTERVVGPDRALDAARLLTAFAHGFISMELNGAFRLGGDVDEAFAFGVSVLVDAIAQRTA